ncbi:MAG TPA: CHAP domain-containing protein, partial [Solirubrobacteraceae bacterium]|nr:CHAP domain-containing protein [Solirubrobacteraceae bacterium]
MSLEAAIARVAQIQGMLAPPAPAQSPVPTASFSSALQTATPTTMTAAAPVAGGTPAGQAMVNLARAEIGVTEQPPGSNESPRISQFRQATAGAPGPGPWCAYFVSWAAREAGVPIGDAGQGYGRVDDVWAWGERSGKAIPAGSGKPQPGDLIVWDEHIGMVESVGADGSIRTIEGNSSNSVAQRTYGSDG